jgi:hypothetical protein
MIGFSNDGNVLSQGCLSVLKRLLQALDIVLLDNLLIWFAVADLPAELLYLTVRVVLHASNSSLLSVPPDVVEVGEELIHKRLADIARALVPKVMGHAEGLLRASYPLRPIQGSYT